MDLDDLTLLLASFGLCSGDPGFNPDADLDGNGCVDLDDLTLLNQNFGILCIEQEGTVDLDIDTDNTNGAAPPDRSPAEDAAEDSPTLPGKFILVNDDDDDRDGVSDKDQAGANASEQDDLVPIVLEITPENPGITQVDYQLSYDETKVRVWRTASRGTLGVDDVPAEQIETYDVAGGAVTLWVEALSPAADSSDLHNVQIAAQADTNADTILDASDVVFATTFALSASPNAGTLGTEVVWTLNPAIPPVAFDASTTAQWSGVYEPLVGPPSSPFTTDYSAAQVRESSTEQAVLVAGDGTFTDAPDLAALQAGGKLVGDVLFAFGGVTAIRAYDFSPAGNAAVWEIVSYPYNNAGSPTIGGEAATLNTLLLSQLPDPNNPSESLLLNATDFHFAAVVRMDENGSTSTEAPATVVADLISFDSLGIETARLSGVVFTNSIRTMILRTLSITMI